MKKIKTGIYGLSPLLDGGFVANSSNVVIGRSGVGKTTFATQFIRRGVEAGQDCIFVSLDETKEEIIKSAVAMGWKNIHEYIESGQLVFLDVTGKDFATFIREKLSTFVSAWKGADTRIAIDPLTPVIWSVDRPYEQRDLLNFLLREIRKVGTVLATLEVYSGERFLSGEDVAIPTYLADCVIHLEHKPPETPLPGKGGFGVFPPRPLHVVKCRQSKHCPYPVQYRILPDYGVVIPKCSHSPDCGHCPLFSAKKNKGVTDPASELASMSDKIPKPLYEMLRREVVEPSNAYSSILTPAELVEAILEEYRESPED